MLIAAAISYVVVEHGGGLVKDPTIGAHPRLIVLLFPLLLAAGIAGVASRAARWAVRRRAIASDIVFLALRRLAAARALLVLLTVTAAVAAAAVTFAEVLRSSLDSNSSEKAYVANGADVQGLIDPVKVVPAGFPFPATKVLESFDNATLADGTHVELLVVDPLALRDVMRWRWAGDPRGALARLATSQASLPTIAVATRGRPDAIWLAGKRIAVHVVATSAAFPGMTAGEPMLVVPADRLARASRRGRGREPGRGCVRLRVGARGSSVDRTRPRELIARAVVLHDRRSLPPERRSHDRLAYLRLPAGDRPRRRSDRLHCTHPLSVCARTVAAA